MPFSITAYAERSHSETKSSKSQLFLLFIDLFPFINEDVLECSSSHPCTGDTRCFAGGHFRKLFFSSCWSWSFRIVTQFIAAQ